MNHIKIVLQILVLFSGFAAFAESTCTLLSKDVEQRKYSFKCNNEVVNIQCAIKNSTVCKVNIREKLKSSSFEITDDQFNSLNLFSNSDLVKTECDGSKKLCKMDGNVCKRYQSLYDSAKVKLINDFGGTGRCSGGLGASIQDIGAFSGAVVSEVEFNKNNCNVMSTIATQSLKNRISVFAKVLDAPILDRTSFLYSCVKPSGQVTTGNLDAEVMKKIPALLEFKKTMLSKMDSSEQLKGLVCGPQSDIFYEKDKLNINNVICAIVEESKLSLSDKTISCVDIEKGTHSDRFSNARDAEQNGAALAKADTVPLESKPMPEVMTSQVGKPIGLTPALAQVDQAVPGSGTAQGVAPSEGNIATGAVRTISASAAMQAGQAFAPVYEKLSNMASSVSSSGRTSVIGRSNSPKINTDASGVVTVSRKLPSSDSRASVDPDALVAAAGSSGGAIANNIDGDSNKASKAAGLQRSTANNTDEVAPVGGPRPISLSSSRSAGGGPGKAAANVASGAANTEAVSSAALAAVQQKITELTTPAKIETFFKKEASNIADLRNLLYSDATSKLLAAKGIRVVNQSGDVSGESMTKAKYVFSDDGIKFTKLNIGKKN
tara:strand:- start:72000 stop:73814 length:1815 start_codon:yes stop_codon:yes gene_type:complete